MWTNNLRTRIIFYLFPGLAALGFLVYAIASLQSAGSGESNREKVLAADFSLSELGEKSVDNVLVANPFGAYLLALVPGERGPSSNDVESQWMIAPPGGRAVSVPVAKGRIPEMFAALDKTTVWALAASGPKSFVTHGVGDEPDARVIFTGDSASTVNIGKAGSRRNDFFIRLGDSDEVFEANGSVREIFSRPADGWRDKVVFSSNPGEVRQVRLEVKEPVRMTRKLFRDGEGWKIEDAGGTRAAKPSASQLVEELYSWEADGFAALSDVPDARKAPIVATMFLSGRATRLGEFHFRPAKNGDYFVTRRAGNLRKDEPEVWLIKGDTVLKMMGRV